MQPYAPPNAPGPGFPAADALPARHRHALVIFLVLFVLNLATRIVFHVMETPEFASAEEAASHYQMINYVVTGVDVVVGLVSLFALTQAAADKSRGAAQIAMALVAFGLVWTLGGLVVGLGGAEPSSHTGHAVQHWQQFFCGPPKSSHWWLCSSESATSSSPAR